MKIVKRDGKIVNYNRDKIVIAISKANLEVSEEERISNDKIENIIGYIESLGKKRMLVEDIQDIIETKLMEYGKYELAKKYIVYRYTRTLVRQKNTMDESILGLIKKTDEEPIYVNPNKNAILASTQRDLIAGEVSKDLTRRILLPTKIAKAHDDGEIFFHDADYFLQSMFDCSYLDLSNMLENGTVINNKLIETPKSFLVACLVTTQIIDSIACNQYGGVTIDVSHLGKYLRKTKEKLESDFIDLVNNQELYKKIINEKLKYELTMGIQLTQYQLNTLMTTNGQYPSVTLFLNLNTNKEYEVENRMIIEEILSQRYQGIKNEKGEYVSPRFPKLVYVLDEDNNFSGGKYDYLTKLAIQCSKKGGYPDYISSKIMKKYYKNNVFAPIGRHRLLTPYLNENNEYKYEGRFNQGLVSVNIAQIAILANDNESKFWSILDDRLDLAKEALMCKYYALLGTISDTSPLHFIYGGISRLEHGEYIDSLLRDGYSTLSLGFIGLNEAVKIIKGEDATTSQGHEFALKIVKRMKNTIEKWKQTADVGFTLYAGEHINTSYYFAHKDKQKFGLIEGVTDKGYYTNSYILEPRSLDLYNRLLLEKDFDIYCNGGCYHIINISKLDNEKNSIELIKFIYENLIYTKFDVDMDECKVCGYKGRMMTSSKHSCECPNCANKDKTKFIINKKLNE